MRKTKIIFITGTDTGVGKTVLTALLLHHLRERGVNALAMKPFCSGGTGDVKLLQSLQRGELTDWEMNPFYFEKPVAPLVATGTGKKAVRLSDVVKKIKAVAGRCECLLVEGSGGLLVPLGPRYTVADLIARLDCQVIVVARNRLGTINHTLLTVQMLSAYGISKRNMSVVLVEMGSADTSSRTNQKVLSEWLDPIEVFGVGSMGKRASTTEKIVRAERKIRSELGALADQAGFRQRA